MLRGLFGHMSQPLGFVIVLLRLRTLQLRHSQRIYTHSMNARTQKLHFANDHPLYFVSQRDRAKKFYEMYFKKVFSIVYLHTESIAYIVVVFWTHYD